MPDPTKLPVNPGQLKQVTNSRTESGTIQIPPNELTQAGAFGLQGGVLTVKNAELANLIHAKLADASKLLPGGRAASDVDVSVGVKIK